MELDLPEHLFKEPEGYFPAEKAPSLISHSLLSGTVLTLRLVGHSPLWGHLLWNAGKVVSTYLESHSQTLVKHRDVLELGAGAGLPGIVCGLNGARHVVITDYPDADLIENLRHNISGVGAVQALSDVSAEGYLWGTDAQHLVRHLQEPDTTFDLLILADVLFNHSEHAKLLSSVTRTLKHASHARALVFFTPYRPWLLQKDLAFFDLAEKAGLVVTKVVETVLDQVMFQDDPGEELLRRTVFGYTLHWRGEVPCDDVALTNPARNA